MSNDTLMDVSRQLKPYRDLSYMSPVYETMEQELASRLAHPSATTAHVVTQAIADPLVEWVERSKGNMGKIAMLAGGALLAGGLINQAFVEALPERKRLKDDTSHITPDGTAIPGRTDGSLRPPTLTDVEADNTSGINYTISGNISSMNAEQIVSALKDPYGSPRSITRNSRNVNPGDVQKIMDRMI
jgi:hypothetical protein